MLDSCTKTEDEDEDEHDPSDRLRILAISCLLSLSNLGKSFGDN